MRHTLKATTVDTPLNHQPMTTDNSCSTSDKPISTIKKRLSVNGLEEVMLTTNFEEVIFPMSNVTLTIINNKHSTSEFLKLFNNHKITSQRHFNSMLQQDKSLMDAFLHLPYNLTNQIISKGLTVAQSALKPITLLDKFNETGLDNSKLIKRLSGLFYELLNEITAENYLPKDFLLRNIFDCLLYRDHKKMTLGFIGTSNSGKTFLVDIKTGS